MMRSAPKIARVLQAVCFAVIVVCGTLALPAERAVAEKLHGPPYYLLVEIYFILLSALLCLATLLLWAWKRGGWWLSIFLDGALALLAAYIALSAAESNTSAPLGFYIFWFVISLSFGSILALLASRPSRTFFRVAVPANSVNQH